MNGISDTNDTTAGHLIVRLAPLMSERVKIVGCSSPVSNNLQVSGCTGASEPPSNWTPSTVLLVAVVKRLADKTPRSGESLN